MGEQKQEGNTPSNLGTVPVRERVSSPLAFWSETSFFVNQKVIVVGSITVVCGNHGLQHAVLSSIPALQDMKVLRLPSGLKAIKEEAFAGLACEAVIIPDGCVEIGSKAFADCENLIYIQIPVSVTSIAEDAFEGCTSVWIDRLND